MNPIRIVVAGLGLRGGTWGIQDLLKNGNDFVLAGLIDNLPARMDLIVRERELSGVPCFTDLETCLEQCDFDALAVFTPDATHADFVIPALEAGKWVFAEKPLDVTEERLEAIIAADRRAGGRTFVGLNLRCTPVYRKLRELLDAGVAGRLLTIQADEFYDGGRTYFRRWNRLRSISGGLWITKACHDFDGIYWLAGAAPQTVYATSSLDYYVPKPEAAMYCRDCALRADCPDRYEQYVKPDSMWARLNAATERETGQRADLCLYNSDKDRGGFDHGVAAVTFANHVLASYTLNVVSGFTNRILRIGGTKATIDADVMNGKIVIRRRDPSSEEQIDLGLRPDHHGGADDHLFSNFARFVRGLPTPYVAPAEAAVGVRIGLAAALSCDQGRVVTMEPASA